MQQGFVPAPLSRRTAAWLIDFALIVVAVIATELLLGRHHCEMRWDVTATGAVVASYGCSAGTMTSNEILGAFYSGVYCIVLWNVLGATLGQRALGIRVLAFEGGLPLPLWRCLVRWAALYGWLVAALIAAEPRLATAAEIALAVYLLSLLRTAMRDRSFGRGWHDRLAGSAAVVWGDFWVRRWLPEDPNARYRRPESERPK